MPGEFHGFYISWGHKESDMTEGLSLIISDMQMAPPYGKSDEELKSLLIKVKESEKVGSKLNIQKTEVMASGPIISWHIDGETMEAVTGFIFLGSKITAGSDYNHEIKRLLLFGGKAMINLDSVLKSIDITLPAKVYTIKAMI